MILFNKYDHIISKYVPLVARLLIGLLFLMTGISKIMDIKLTQMDMSQMGLTYTGFFIVIAIIIELIGSLSIILGYATRFSALTLSGYMIVLNLIFHLDPSQHVIFMLNWAIIGGLLLLFTYGPGPISFDAHNQNKSPN